MANYVVLIPRSQRNLHGRGIILFALVIGLVELMKIVRWVRPLCRLVLGGSLVAGMFLLLGCSQYVRAQSSDVRVGDVRVPLHSEGDAWKDCGLRKIDLNTFTSVRAPAPSKQTPTANFQVNYSGFSSEARTAFERAVAVWETRIQSDIPIRIDASYEPLGPGVLGGTSPTFAYALDSNSDGEYEAFVIDALADALSEEDQQPGSPDFRIVINSARSDWHFGQEDAPGGTIDFTSVVLHEIAHGLGYLEASTVNGDSGEYGIDFSGDGRATPSVFARHLAEQSEDDARTSLMNEAAYPNPSERLGEALTGNRLVFHGANAITTAAHHPGPDVPKIYAPESFQSGSSISHLDELTYPPGAPNALMTPALNTAETNRLPGPILCGQLHDMLWPLGKGCQQYLADVFALGFSNAPDPQQGRVTLSWRARDDVSIDEFVVEHKYFDGSFQPVQRVDGPPVVLDSLGLGRHTFRVRWVRADGSEGTTVRTVETTFKARNLGSAISSRDEEGRASTELSWEVPVGTDGYTYHLERQTGNSGPFVDVASLTTTNHTFQRQTPGRYKYRVRATDAFGNTVMSAETETVEIDFDGEVYVLGPYPNPSSEQVSFDLTSRAAQLVRVEVFDVTGQRMYFASRGLGAEAPEFITLDVGEWSSGMYFLRVRGRDFTKTRKMIVLQ